MDAVTLVVLSEDGFNKGLEIVALSRSKVVSSPKKFKLACNLSRIDPDAVTKVHIKEPEDFAVMQSATVCVKAVLAAC